MKHKLCRNDTETDKQLNHQESRASGRNTPQVWMLNDLNRNDIFPFCWRPFCFPVTTMSHDRNNSSRFFAFVAGTRLHRWLVLTRILHFLGGGTNSCTCVNFQLWTDHRNNFRSRLDAMVVKLTDLPYFCPSLVTYLVKTFTRWLIGVHQRGCEEDVLCIPTTCECKKIQTNLIIAIKVWVSPPPIYWVY